MLSLIILTSTHHVTGSALKVPPQKFTHVGGGCEPHPAVIVSVLRFQIPTAVQLLASLPGGELCSLVRSPAHTIHSLHTCGAHGGVTCG